MTGPSSQQIQKGIEEDKNACALVKMAYIVSTGRSSNIGTDSTTRCEDIARWDFPVQLIHGERSPGRYAAMGEAARKCNTAIGKAWEIPEAAHSMNRENPAAFNQAVLKFLSRLGH